MSQPSAPGSCKWMEEPAMPMVEGLLASGLISSTTRVKLKEIEPNLKDEYQKRNLKRTNKTSSTTKPSTTSGQRSDTSKKISNRTEGQESHYQKKKLLHFNQSSKAAHRKSASPSLGESTSKYLSFATPPPNFSIQNNENANLNQYNPDDTNISIGIPIDQILLTKKRYIGKREIQRLLSDYMNKLNNYTTTIADSQMCKDENNILNDPSFEYKELEKMLNITFATWNSAITTIRGYSDEYARLLYEIKKFFQKRVEKFPEIIQKYDEKIENLNSVNNSQKEEIDHINTIIAEKDYEIETYKKKIEELTYKIFHLENDKEELNARINNAEYSKEHIEEEYNTAVFRLTKSEAERKRSTQVLQSTQELLESCRSQIAHQEEVIGKYEEEGAGFRPLYTRAASENQQYIKDLNDLREKMKNMVVKQETVNVEVQTNPVKIVNETKSKKTTGTTRSTKKSSKKLRKQQSTVTVRNIMEKYDPTVLNSTATTTPDNNKKKKKKPSSASKQVSHSSVISPTNLTLKRNNSAEASGPTSVNVSAAVSPCLNEYMVKNQGILKSTEKINPITHCVSFDSVSDALDMSGDIQPASNFNRNRSHSCFSREQSHASFSRDQSHASFSRDQSNATFARDQSNVSFSRDQSNASFALDPCTPCFARDQSRIKFGSRNSSTKKDDVRSIAKSQSHLLNKETENNSKYKSANLTPTLSPIISQSCNQSLSPSADSSSSTSPEQCRFLSPTKSDVLSPGSIIEIPTLPPDYNIRETFDADSDTLIGCVYRLLPLPLGTSSIYIHRADPQIESIMQGGNTSARLSESSIIPNYKSYNWLIQRIIDFFHSVLNLDQTSNQYIDSVSMFRATIAENTKIEALSERILEDVIKTALMFKKSPIVSIFLKVITYEITTSEYKFLNMLFNLAFEYIYPSVQSLLDNPDLSPSTPESQFLIHRSICEEIATKIFKHVQKEALEAVQSIQPNSKWSDLIDYWEFTLKMITFFTQTHKRFQRQARAILTLARLNSQTNVNDSINNDNVIITKQNFCDFMIFIRPSIRNKEMEKLYNHFYLECRHRLTLESPVKGKNNQSKELEDEEATPLSSTQYNFIRYCTDFPEITEDILKLKFKEDFSIIYSELTTPLQELLQFILKRFTDYTKFTQPRLLSPLLEMTKPVLSQMRNALLRCDTSMAFSCYRHVLQLIDLKCSEACPFTIFDKSIKIEDVQEATKLIIAREKIVASHIFGNSINHQFKKDDKENEDKTNDEQQNNEEIQVVDENKAINESDKDKLNNEGNKEDQVDIESKTINGENESINQENQAETDNKTIDETNKISQNRQIDEEKKNANAKVENKPNNKENKIDKNNEITTKSEESKQNNESNKLNNKSETNQKKLNDTKDNNKINDNKTIENSQNKEASQTQNKNSEEIQTTNKDQTKKANKIQKGNQAKDKKEKQTNAKEQAKEEIKVIDQSKESENDKNIAKSQEDSQTIENEQSKEIIENKNIVESKENSLQAKENTQEINNLQTKESKQVKKVVLIKGNSQTNDTKPNKNAGQPKEAEINEKSQDQKIEQTKDNMQNDETSTSTENVQIEKIVESQENATVHTSELVKSQDGNRKLKDKNSAEDKKQRNENDQANEQKSANLNSHENESSKCINEESKDQEKQPKPDVENNPNKEKDQQKVQSSRIDQKSQINKVTKNNQSKNNAKADENSTKENKHFNEITNTQEQNTDIENNNANNKSPTKEAIQLNNNEENSANCIKKDNQPKINQNTKNEIAEENLHSNNNNQVDLHNANSQTKINGDSEETPKTNVKSSTKEITKLNQNKENRAKSDNKVNQPKNSLQHKTETDNKETAKSIVISPTKVISQINHTKDNETKSDNQPKNSSCDKTETDNKKSAKTVVISPTKVISQLNHSKEKSQLQNDFDENDKVKLNDNQKNNENDPTVENQNNENDFENENDVKEHLNNARSPHKLSQIFQQYKSNQRKRFVKYNQNAKFSTPKKEQSNKEQCQEAQANNELTEKEKDLILNDEEHQQRAE